MKFLKSGLAAGLVIFVISMVASITSQSLFNYNMLSLPGIRNQNDPAMILFFLAPFLLGIFMAYAYDKFKVKSGVEFGGIVWMFYSLTSSLIVYASMTYPVGFTINQLLGGLVSLIAAGIVIEKISEKK